MYEFHYTTENPEDPYLPSCYGTVLTTVKVGGKERRALLYMPEKARACTIPVVVLLPNGWTCERGLAETNWARLADEDEHRDKFVVMFLEPENGENWNLDAPHGDPEGPAAYVMAAQQVIGTIQYVSADVAMYGLIGYGEGGTAAQMAAMSLPANISCVVSVGAPPVSENFIRAAGEDICSHLTFYTFSGAHLGIKNREIPMPVWIIDDPAYTEASSAASLRYWMDCCGVDESPVKAAPDTDAYLRSKPTRYPINEEREAYRVWYSVFPGVVADMGERLNRRFWTEFLYRHQRLPGDPEGSLHIHRDPVYDCGAEYHYERVDGWMREWFTYVPESVKAAPDKAAPLVVAIHGYGCSGNYYFNDSQWFKVADDRGFILVCPSGVNGGAFKFPGAAFSAMAPSWNQIAYPKMPNECTFFRELVEITCREHRIDRSRVFATGHSNGSTTSHLLGLSLPDVFTAIGCVGGAIPGFFRVIITRPESANRPSLKVPVWIFGGMEEPDIMPACPADGNITAETINLWMEINDLPTVSGEAWEQGWVRRGKYSDLVFSDESRPLVRFSNVKGMPHASPVELSYRLWDEFFSKYSRGADGEPVYAHF